MDRFWTAICLTTVLLCSSAAAAEQLCEEVELPLRFDGIVYRCGSASALKMMRYLWAPIQMHLRCTRSNVGYTELPWDGQGASTPPDQGSLLTRSSASSRFLPQYPVYVANNLEELAAKFEAKESAWCGMARFSDARACHKELSPFWVTYVGTPSRDAGAAPGSRSSSWGSAGHLLLF